MNSTCVGVLTCFSSFLLTRLDEDYAFQLLPKTRSVCVLICFLSFFSGIWIKIMYFNFCQRSGMYVCVYTSVSRHLFSGVWIKIMHFNFLQRSGERSECVCMCVCMSVCLPACLPACTCVSLNVTEKYIIM